MSPGLVKILYFGIEGWGCRAHDLSNIWCKVVSQMDCHCSYFCVKWFTWESTIIHLFFCDIFINQVLGIDESTLLDHDLWADMLSVQGSLCSQHACVCLQQRPLLYPPHPHIPRPPRSPGVLHAWTLHHPPQNGDQIIFRPSICQMLSCR